MLLLLLGLLAAVTSPGRSGHEADVRCLSCANVAKPEDCISYERCNLDEVCFTHEIFDHHGHRAFRLGCESSSVCELVSSPTILGRRDVTADDSPEQTDVIDSAGDVESDVREDNLNPGLTPHEAEFCFQCCSSDDCNVGLCEEVLGLNRTHAALLGTCPAPFIKGPNSCLYFHVTPTTWSSARASCRKMSSDLVKVDNQGEDLFIVSQLEQQHYPKNSLGFWTGGHLDVLTDEYVWLDHTAMTYTRWGDGEPKNMASDRFVMYFNPTLKAVDPNWEWTDWPNAASSKAGFICERSFIL